MLFLKLANLEDVQKEYEAISQMPLYETGFENRYALMSRAAFETAGIRNMIDQGEGRSLLRGDVRQLYYFLWDDDEIVGLFKIRPQLNREYYEGAGHLAYGIIEKYRNRGYATAGMKLAIDICRKLVSDDELYLAAYSDNEASIRVMKNNGAYLVRKEKGISYMRVRLDDGKTG